MNKKVFFFTRSGNSKRIAEKIADKTGAELVEIKDNMNWKGIWGFIKGGFYAVRNKTVEITYDSIVSSEDICVLVSPVWGGVVTPSASAFLKKVDASRVVLVVNSGGEGYEKALLKAEEKHGKFFGKAGLIGKSRNEDSVIQEITNLVRND